MPENILDDLMKTLNFEDNELPMTNRFIADPSDDGTKILAAMQSRFPISHTQSLVDLPDGFQVDPI